MEKLVYWISDDMTPVCDSRFVRKLERELNEANEMFRKLNIHALDLTDRIRRLEEAGDALAKTQTYDLVETVNWRKAKEDKP
jgi:predicted nuclease with TOPRIM domain